MDNEWFSNHVALILNMTGTRNSNRILEKFREQMWWDRRFELPKEAFERYHKANEELMLLANQVIEEKHNQD